MVEFCADIGAEVTRTRATSMRTIRFMSITPFLVKKRRPDICEVVGIAA